MAILCLAQRIEDRQRPVLLRDLTQKLQAGVLSPLTKAGIGNSFLLTEGRAG